MKNMQITLSNESIDKLITQLKKQKEDNDMVIRMGGGPGEPELIFVHTNFKVPEKKEKKEGKKGEEEERGQKKE